jgi:2-polyprenyl-3-methyl-5-hydroxy-6-metoxy-1,4-benzoquinol methylase
MNDQNHFEKKAKQRFEFGKNWTNYVKDINEQKILEAENSLKDYLNIERLDGKKFLDIGSGSGVFSLAAVRLGACVVSFDYDNDSVEATKSLHNKYWKNDGSWRILKGSVLDKDFLKSLGEFDIVYSWGVLHHTGAMLNSMENVLIPLKASGVLYIALYNDQGRLSRLWKIVKKNYVRSSKLGKKIIELVCLVGLWGPALLRDLIIFKPFNTWRNYKINRGMSPFVDLVDWVGGYPFEVATPDLVFNFYSKNGLKLLRISTCAGGHGCNQFVFVKEST